METVQTQAGTKAPLCKDANASRKWLWRSPDRTQKRRLLRRCGERGTYMFKPLPDVPGVPGLVQCSCWLLAVGQRLPWWFPWCELVKRAGSHGKMAEVESPRRPAAKKLWWSPARAGGWDVTSCPPENPSDAGDDESRAARPDSVWLLIMMVPEQGTRWPCEAVCLFVPELRSAMLYPGRGWRFR